MEGSHALLQVQSHVVLSKELFQETAFGVWVVKRKTLMLSRSLVVSCSSKRPTTLRRWPELFCCETQLPVKRLFTGSYDPGEFGSGSRASIFAAAGSMGPTWLFTNAGVVFPVGWKIVCGAAERAPRRGAAVGTVNARVVVLGWTVRS